MKPKEAWWFYVLAGVGASTLFRLLEQVYGYSVDNGTENEKPELLCPHEVALDASGSLSQRGRFDNLVLPSLQQDSRGPKAAQTLTDLHVANRSAISWAHSPPAPAPKEGEGGKGG